MYEHKKSDICVFVDFKVNLLNNEKSNITRNLTILCFAWIFFPSIDRPNRITTYPIPTLVVVNVFTNVMNKSTNGRLLISNASDVPVFTINYNAKKHSERKIFLYLKRKDDSSLALFKQKLLERKAGMCTQLLMSMSFMIMIAFL